ncbi:MAG: Gldg family protein [Clostridia bacterium]|nr:Gldg family protein [Clostridia bacterium]
MNNYNRKISNVSKKPNTKVIVAAVIAVVVLLNVAIQFLPDGIRRFDITSSKSYTLSESTKKYFSELDEKVTFYVLDADGSDLKYEHFLKRLDSGFDNIDVKWTSSEKVTHLTEELGISTENITPYFVIAEGDKRKTAVSHADLMFYRTENSTLTSFFGTKDLSLVEYEYYKQVLAEQAQSSSEYAEQYASMLEALLYDVDMYCNAEPYLCSIVEYVTVDIIPARYTLTGHGEVVFTDTEIGHYLSDTVGMVHKELDISDGSAIPEDAVSIVVFDPDTDITKAEADMLIAYLDNGGQMAFFTSNEDLDLPNLMSVINAYGFSAEKGIVSELIVKESEDSSDGEGDVEDNADNNAEDGAENNAEEGSDEENGDTAETYSTDTVGVYINTAHAAMSDLVGMNVSPKITKGNSISFTNTDGLTRTFLLTTSDNAYVGDNADDRGARSLAAVSEKDGGGTLLWFTGADSFTSPILENTDDTEEFTRIYSNCALVLTSLSLAPYTYESTVTLPEAKYYGERLMSATETGFVVFIIVIAVAVVALSVVGVIIWYKRKKA